MITYYLITLLSFLIPAFLFFLLWTFFVFRKKNNFGRALLFFVAAFSCGIAMEGKLQLPLLILFVSIPFALSLSKGFFERFFCLNNFILRKHKQVLIFLKSRPKKPFDRLRANGEFVQQISKKITTTLLLSLIFFCAGFFSMALKKNIIHQKNQFLKKEMCAISGTVKQKEVFPIPRHKESILLHVKKINGKNITASFDIIIYLQRDTKILEGDYITIENISLNKKYQAAQLTQKPDFSDFLSKKGISASVFVESLHYKILSRPLRSFRAWVSKTRTKITGALKTKCKPAVFHLFSTIFLGNTQPNKNMMEQKKCFARWGISHFLARSGLHIALFILLWKLFLSFLPIPIFFKHFFLLALCVVYFLFSWPSISFIRALSVFLLFEIGTIFWQRISTLHLLLFTCFFVLALNPLQLFFLDFQLSFSLSIALAWVFQKKTPMAVAKK